MSGGLLILGGGMAFLGLILGVLVGGVAGGISLISGIAILAVTVLDTTMHSRAPAQRGRDW